jgi:chromosome partitioning protein
MKKIVFFNTKGGTGKTTLCYNYGWYLAEKRNKKILFIDLDPQTNLVQAFNKGSSNIRGNNLDKLIVNYIKGININFEDYVMKINKNIDLLPSSNNISLVEEYLTDYLLERTFSENKIYKSMHRSIIIKKILEENITDGSYDYVIIDSQPSFTLLSTTSIIYAKNIIVVIKPELFSYLDINYLSKVIKNLEKKFEEELKIFVVIINAFEKIKKTPKEVIYSLKKKYGDKLCIINQKIRYLVAFQKSIFLNRKPVFMAYPDSEATKDVLKAFAQIDELEDNII